ncbi:serine/threonine protein kinase, partial [Streptomyces sp. SID5926]|nr:serine/threonine protein kinase [Streptomyces sp. SID5926]
VASCLDKDHEGRPTAAELVERAAAHGPSAAAQWPRDITERLAERAAFAAREPVPPPSEPDAAVPPPPSASAPVVTGGRPEKRERRRRTKVLAL